MRALAEFIMRGRTQAVIVSVLGVGTVLFAWISAAAIALVVLRRGLNQGLYVLAWTLVPAVLVARLGDVGPLLTVCAVVPLAQALRLTASWQWTLMSASAIGVLIAVVFVTTPMGLSAVAVVQDVLQRFIEQLAASAGTQQQVVLPELSVQDIAGGMALHAILVTVVSLLLGRWWQALLYNPGGFREEFHRLRVHTPMAAALLLLTVAVWALAPGYWLWGLLLLLPLFIAGFALAHGIVGLQNMGGQWLVVFYLIWLFSSWAKVALLVLALVDSAVDFRRRLGGGPPATR